MRSAVIVLVLLGLGGACTPRNLSPECKDSIDHCLKACPPTEDHMGIGGGGLMGIGDARGKCERRCHNICTDPEDKTPAEPPDEEGIPTL